MPDTRRKQSRRQFLAASAALPFALRAFAASPGDSARWMLLGTGTDKGILRASFDSDTGSLGAFEVAATTSHPTYLALHPTLPVLYAANELPEGDGQVSSFRLQRANATLAPLTRTGTGGNGPCFVSVDHTGRAAFAANYGGGSLAFFNLDANGDLTTQTHRYDCNANAACGTLGPVKSRQDAAHMHCATVSPDNRFVLACNLGEDAIEIFPFAASATPMFHGVPQCVPTRAGTGPRHVVFHPNGRWLYCAHELACEVELFDWSVRRGKNSLVARAGGVRTILAPGASPDSDSPTPNTACEIAVSPDGRFVYANARGENSLTVFAIDAASGMLTQLQRIGTGGTLTRHFAFDPTRRWLLCANQGSSNITVFSHDPSTGRLGVTPRTITVDTPMFIQFV
jgi:6-phosphogluconolactonase